MKNILLNYQVEWIKSWWVPKLWKKETGRTMWLAADRRSKGVLLSIALKELICKHNYFSRLSLYCRLNKPATGYFNQCFTGLVWWNSGLMDTRLTQVSRTRPCHKERRRVGLCSQQWDQLKFPVRCSQVLQLLFWSRNLPHLYSYDAPYNTISNSMRLLSAITLEKYSKINKIRRQSDHAACNIC